MSARPRKVGNRTLYRQMLAWGWVKEGHRGDRWRMRHPSSRVLVEIMSPHVHTGNPSETIAEVYDVTCDGDVDAFWDHVADEVVDGADRVAAREIRATDDGAREAARTSEFGMGLSCSEVRVVDHVDARDVAPTLSASFPVIDPDDVATGAVVLPERGSASPNRGAAAIILAALIERGTDTTTTAQAMADLVGVPIGTAQNALAYLATKDLAERVMRGTYRLGPRMAADVNVRHYSQDLDRLAAIIAGPKTDPIAAAERQSPAYAEAWAAGADVPPPTAPGTEYAPLRARGGWVPPTEPDGEWTVAPLPPRAQPEEFAVVDGEPTDDDLLQLIDVFLVPGGLRATHLPAVGRWLDATRTLIRLVNGA